LSDPDQKIVQILLYLFSFESFIPYVVNKASRDKNFDKIKTMGPYATALGLIVGWAQEKKCLRECRDGTHKLYRGLAYTRK
jgi:lipid-binding SYLF domain-containing protein